MKVLHIASGDLWAGAEKALYTLILALQQSSQVRIAAVILNPGALAEKLRDADVELLVLDESRQNTLQLMHSVSLWVEKTRPDIIHTHRSKENIIGSLVGTRHRIPSVRTQHGASEHSFSALNLRKRAIHDIDFLSGRLLQRSIIAVSAPLAAELRKSFGTKKVCVIANGIDTGPDEWDQEDKFRPPLAIGIVGRLAPVKRVDLFLRIAARVLSSPNTASKACFRIIGDGPLRPALTELATELGIDDQLTFEGHVDNAEAHIADLDILVICSDHEGLPMVALEAMKHRTLIVTHRIGGLPELLGDGEFGCVLDRQQIESFAGALEDIIRQPEAAARKAELARHQLQKHFSSSAMARGHLELYRQTLAAH